MIDDRISRAAIAQALPADMRAISQRVATAVDEDFADLSREDRDLCIAVCVATAVLELDKAGCLNILPRDAAWLYQIGRVGAEELSWDVRLRLRDLLVRPAIVSLWVSADHIDMPPTRGSLLSDLIRKLGRSLKKARSLSGGGPN